MIDHGPALAENYMDYFKGEEKNLNVGSFQPGNIKIVSNSEERKNLYDLQNVVDPQDEAVNITQALK